MNEYYLFCDSSINPQLSFGFGAILQVAKSEWELDRDFADLIRFTPRLAGKSIARLELTTINFALENYLHSGISLDAKLTVFTDSETVANLGLRRAKLEFLNFSSRRTKLRLTNADLYQAFYQFQDRIRFSVNWVKGHTRESHRNRFDHTFALVDRAARNRLRAEILQLQSNSSIV